MTEDRITVLTKRALMAGSIRRVRSDDGRSYDIFFTSPSVGDVVSQEREELVDELRRAPRRGLRRITDVGGHVLFDAEAAGLFEPFRRRGNGLPPGGRDLSDESLEKDKHSQARLRAAEEQIRQLVRHQPDIFAGIAIVFVSHGAVSSRIEPIVAPAEAAAAPSAPEAA